jgi:protein-L-isoaspartate(D-aspartate) O-methyltransferase
VLRTTLVDQLKREGHIRTPHVEAAFRAIPRHEFVPGVAPEQAYHDQSIPVKQLDGTPVSSSSQPAIMAIMLEQLNLQPGQRVLEIGAGTGYNAALMAHLVGEEGQVVTLDIDEDLVAGAREHLAAAGFDRVHVVRGDGGVGYLDAAPYDRIILTVGAWDIAPAWREQMTPGGRLVLPLSIKAGIQASVAFERVGDHLASRSVFGCGFVMLRGAFAGPETRLALGPEPGLNVTLNDRSPINAEATYQALVGPSRDWATKTQVMPRDDLGSGLSLWLALREPGFCWLSAEGPWVERGIVPDLFRWSSLNKFITTIGLLGDTSMCVLARSPEPPQAGPDAAAFGLRVRQFGRDDALAQRLIDRLADWDAAGRPSIEGLRIAAYANDAPGAPAGYAVVVEKRWTRLALAWEH